MKRKFGSDSEEYKKLHGRLFFPAIISAGGSEREYQVEYIEACANGLKHTITELNFYLKKGKRKRTGTSFTKPNDKRKLYK